MGIYIFGGRIDAGDHGKFMLPMSFSATAPTWGGLRSFPQSYVANGQGIELVSHLRFVTDLFLESLGSRQAAPC